MCTLEFSKKKFSSWPLNSSGMYRHDRKCSIMVSAKYFSKRLIFSFGYIFIYIYFHRKMEIWLYFGSILALINIKRMITPSSYLELIEVFSCLPYKHGRCEKEKEGKIKNPPRWNFRSWLWSLDINYFVTWNARGKGTFLFVLAHAKSSNVTFYARTRKDFYSCILNYYDS